MSLPWFIVTVFSYFAYLVAIVNSSVGITLSTLSVFVAIEMRAEVYGNQDSQSFSFAFSKAINTRKYSQLCVDSFLTVTIKSERRAWRYTSYSTGSTHNYSPRTRDHPTGIALIPPSPAAGIGYTGTASAVHTSLSSDLSIVLRPSWWHMHRMHWTMETIWQALTRKSVWAECIRISIWLCKQRYRLNIHSAWQLWYGRIWPPYLR